MKRAISLALLGTETGVNPRVGCVVVRNGRVIGEGFHACCGGAHAERAALADVRERGSSARGSTLYVTLEPCSHFGKTPPCAPLIVEEGVERVVIGMLDPNPKVNGAGVEILKNAGIEVVLPEEIGDVSIESECKWINRGFIRHHTLSRPWVTLKAAMSIDGMMALSDGTSKWLTGIEARTAAHELRAEHDGILVGVGTVIADDPELTVRHIKNANVKNPRRVILDTHLRTPPASKAVRDAIIVCDLTPPLSKGGEEKTSLLLRKTALEAAGARVVGIPSHDGQVDLDAALKFLAENGIQRLLVEGGANVISSFISAGSCDAAAIFVAPKFLGQGINITRGLQVSKMEDTENFALENVRTRMIGKDIFIDGLFKNTPKL